MERIKHLSSWPGQWTTSRYCMFILVNIANLWWIGCALITIARGRNLLDDHLKTWKDCHITLVDLVLPFLWCTERIWFQCNSVQERTFASQDIILCRGSNQWILWVLRTIIACRTSWQPQRQDTSRTILNWCGHSQEIQTTGIIHC